MSSSLNFKSFQNRSAPVLPFNHYNNSGDKEKYLQYDGKKNSRCRKKQDSW
jgi:hypothetical protein